MLDAAQIGFFLLVSMCLFVKSSLEVASGILPTVKDLSLGISETHLPLKHWLFQVEKKDANFKEEYQLIFKEATEYIPGTILSAHLGSQNMLGIRWHCYSSFTEGKFEAQRN